MTAPTQVYPAPVTGGGRRRRRVSPWLVGVVFTVAVLVLAEVAFGFYVNARVASITTHADKAQANMQQFMDALSNDPGSAQGHLDDALAELGAARDELHAPPISQLQALPWVTRNVEVADTVLDHMTRVVKDAGPVLIELSGVVDFQKGSLKPIPSFSGNVIDTFNDGRQAVKTISDARDVIGGIDTVGLMPDLQRAVGDTKTMLDEVYRKVAPVQSMMQDIEKYVPPSFADALERLRKALG